MGLPTGFLEIERKERPYDKVEARLKTWKEFIQPLPYADIGKQGARCMDCGIPFCHNGCPVNNMIPDWNELVRRDRWQAALEVLGARAGERTRVVPQHGRYAIGVPCKVGQPEPDHRIGDDALRLRHQASLVPPGA